MTMDPIKSEDVDIRPYAQTTSLNFHYIDLPFINTNDIVPAGIDIGYSGLKVYSVFGYHILPSLPIRVYNEQPFVEVDTDICYRDEKGNLWYIGETARRALDRMEDYAQDPILYGRSRIQNEEYRVLARVGMFLALLRKDENGRLRLHKGSTLKIQTGLPDQYIRTERETLREQFTGLHNFEIKLGANPWMKVSINIENDDVKVMTQPFGGLWSVAANRYGELINTDLLMQNVLIFDGGFYTSDTYYNFRGVRKGRTTTWVNISMHEIYRRTLEIIGKNTNGKAELPIHTFANFINSRTPGKIPYGYRKVYDFTNDLLKVTEEVAKEAIIQLENMYNYLNEVEVLVCTGGTGKLFYPYFKEHFGDYLEVVMAEKTDAEDPVENFDVVFANVVGFFNCMVASLREESGYDSEDTQVEDFVAVTNEEQKSE